MEITEGYLRLGDGNVMKLKNIYNCTITAGWNGESHGEVQFGSFTILPDRLIEITDTIAFDEFVKLLEEQHESN